MTTTTESKVTPDEEEDEQQFQRARDEAEARRKRILEQAHGRLDVVTGVATTTTTETEDVVAGTGDHGGEEEGTESGGGGGGGVSSSTKHLSSGQAKLAAMRRRRYKKGTAAAAGGATGNETDATPTTTETTTTIPEPAVASEPTHKVTTPVEKEEEEEEEHVAATTTSHDEEPEEKKKYMGVAKMRRKMIKEKQMAAAAAAASDEHDATGPAAASSSSSTTTSTAAAAQRLYQKKRKAVYTLPILMHVVTIVLLFWVGLDLGLQQTRTETVLVHTGVAPVQDGLAIFRVSPSSSASSSLWSFFRTKSTSSLAGSEEQRSDLSAVVQDEFSDVTRERKPKNIDPLFGVDLDEYTAGPGLFMMAGRLAVRAHRINLALFYYFPVNTIRSMRDFVRQLIRMPPMLCLLALAIRQVVGKLLLGAKLPDKSDDDTEPGAGTGKDVMAMIKSFIMSFTARAFPTMVGLYDAFVHLRADMYVVVCGFLVGLAWNHMGGPGLLQASSGLLSERPEETIIPGIDTATIDATGEVFVPALEAADVTPPEATADVGMRDEL